MRRVLLCGAFMLAGFIIASGAHAASQDEAQSHYDEGRYDEAAAMGAALATSEGYTLASKSLIGKTSLLLRKARSLDEIGRAVSYAGKALELDPENIEAHLQYATGLGLRGRLVSKFRAQMEGLPEEARVHLKRAIELDPDHSWANAFLAAWHLEIVRNGGATLARTIYGASLDVGLPMYDRALTLGLISPVLPYEYAQFVLALNYWEYREKADELLAMSAALPPRNHQERAVHERAAELQAALAEEDPGKVLGLIAKHLGTKKIRVPRKR